jgi:hypothetical protein
MRLQFKTSKGTQYLEWAHYALLRDNVQHYLESGPRRASFNELHAVEHAVDGEPKYLHALELRRELQLAWAALANLPLSRSAISLRTRALLTGTETPLVRGTLQASALGWALPVQADENRPLRDVVAPFVESLLVLTDLASPLDDVCVARASG